MRYCHLKLENWHHYSLQWKHDIEVKLVVVR
ncbi:MAG: hypothetical protein ACJAWD_000533 [Methylophilaceae bacterium]|jgi:hypothetical protein